MCIVIFLFRNSSLEVSTYEPGLLSSDRLSLFWIEWPDDTSSRTVRIGSGVPGENVLLTYDTKQITSWPFGLVEAVAISSAPDTSGVWEFNQFEATANRFYTPDDYEHLPVWTMMREHSYFVFKVAPSLQELTVLFLLPARKK